MTIETIVEIAKNTKAYALNHYIADDHVLLTWKIRSAEGIDYRVWPTSSGVLVHGISGLKSEMSIDEFRAFMRNK